MSDFVPDYAKRSPVGAKSIEAILGALREAGKPCSIPDLQRLTGKSYPTVKYALTQSGAQRVPNTYPAKFVPSDQIVTVIGKTYEHVADRVLIDLRKDDPSRNWNGSSNRIGNQVKDLTISRHSNPTELLKKFTDAASLFATIAHDLDLVATRPDWFDLLMKEGEVSDDNDADSPQD